MRSLQVDVLDAYLRRLGVDAEPPSAAALARLHRAHVERIPYETWWIHACEPWDTDPYAAASRIAVEDRGGYCYHLNGAFALLLTALGYEVRRHTGGVHGPAGPSDQERGNHLVLTVTGLPSDDNPTGTWYVDAGLGDALHDPLPLVPGTWTQGPFTLTLARWDGDGQDAGSRDAGWQLRHDPRGGFGGMAWTLDDADTELQARQHGVLSTSPDSGFVRIGLAQTRDATGVDVVRGLTLIRVDRDGRTERDLTGRSEWFAALADLFGLTFVASPPGTTDRLWSRVEATHRDWDAAGRP